MPSSVLQYLEGMSKHSAGNSPPTSVNGGLSHGLKSPKSDRHTLEHVPLAGMGSPRLFSPSPKGSRTAQQLEDLSKLDYEKHDVEEDGDDAGSNEQQGHRSEFGEEQALPVVSIFHSWIDGYSSVDLFFSANLALRIHLAPVTNPSILVHLLATLVLFL